MEAAACSKRQKRLINVVYLFNTIYIGYLEPRQEHAESAEKLS